MHREEKEDRERRDEERRDRKRRDSMSYYDVDAILTDSQVSPSRYREVTGSREEGYQEETKTRKRLTEAESPLYIRAGCPQAGLP